MIHGPMPTWYWRLKYDRIYGEEWWMGSLKGFIAENYALRAELEEARR